MNLGLLNFVEKKRGHRIGFVTLKYGELLIRCEVMRSRPGMDERPFWFRIPNVLVQMGKKTVRKNLVTWNTKEDSDKFQAEALSEWLGHKEKFFLKYMTE